MSEGSESARALAQRVAWGQHDEGLTAAIERCGCPAEVKAGLFLLNGDWHRAHTLVQSLSSVTANHWHALVHRVEPDYANSKYWLKRVGDSPIYPRLAEAAAEAGQTQAVAPGGRWDPLMFTDAFADRSRPAWTRRLHLLEMEALLEHCLDSAEAMDS